jgi:signal peptidase I
MQTVNLVKSEILFPVIIDLIKSDQKAILTVTGSSMTPFLRDTRDRVEFSATSFMNIKRGDIVLVKRKNGYYVMHRVWKKEKDCFFMVGDAQRGIEGPLYPEQLIALVTTVWRKNKKIDCNNIWWRAISEIWLRLRNFRYLLMRLFKYLKPLS